MDLIVTERYATYLAYMQGGEFTEGDTFELSAEDLLAWIRQKKEAEQKLTPQLEANGDSIILSFANDIGVISHQMIIECNEHDRGELVRVLSEACI